MFRTVIARGFGEVYFVPFPTGETPVVPVRRQDGGSPYGRDKRSRNGIVVSVSRNF